MIIPYLDDGDTDYLDDVEYVNDGDYCVDSDYWLLITDYWYKWRWWDFI